MRDFESEIGRLCCRSDFLNHCLYVCSKIGHNIIFLLQMTHSSLPIEAQKQPVQRLLPDYCRRANGRNGRTTGRTTFQGRAFEIT